MDFTTITYEKQDRIAVITLNRPEKFNTIRPPMPAEVGFTRSLSSGWKRPCARARSFRSAGKT